METANYLYDEGVGEYLGEERVREFFADPQSGPVTIEGPPGLYSTTAGPAEKCFGKPSGAACGAIFDLASSIKGALADFPVPACEVLAARVRRVLCRVQYKDWRFRVGAIGGAAWLAVEFDAPDAVTGIRMTQLGRKWLIEAGATDEDVARTALKAVLTAEEHEARERFTYRGRAVFGPHGRLA